MPFGPEAAADLALHMKKNSRAFAKEKCMTNREHFEFSSSTFPGYMNNIGDVRGRERGKWIMVPASHIGERNRARRLQSEQKSYFLFRELVSRFSQPGNLVEDLFARTFSAAAAYFTVPRRRVF